MDRLRILGKSSAGREMCTMSNVQLLVLVLAHQTTQSVLFLQIFCDPIFPIVESLVGPGGKYEG
jgi:hypothetical protein